MDNNYRLLLVGALTVVILLLWNAWQQDQRATALTATASAPTGAPAIPKDIPQTPHAQPPSAVPAVSAIPVAPAAVLQTGSRVKVITDVLAVEIDTVGADIRVADLLTYPEKLDEPKIPVRLFTDDPSGLFIPQAGLTSNGSKAAAPDHHAVFVTDRLDYRLEAGASTLKVPLRWVSPDGVMVTKTYTFHRGDFAIDVDYVVLNGAATEWRGLEYLQLQRRKPEEHRSMFQAYAYTGGVIYGPETKYEKISFDDMLKQPLSRDVSGGWLAMIQHYFVTAWVPPVASKAHYYTQALPNEHLVLGMYTPEVVVAPGQSSVPGALSGKLFVGPKLQERLEKLAPGLELTVDYGILTVISKPLYWLMEWIHKGVHNWGWSIIILTLLIKLAFYKLSEASYKSMSNMRRLQPKLAQIKERYGDDRQRFSQAMMEMYKKEKINPLGGCLPMVVQIPVFISLYWVLLESVELRQAPFIFWLHDLSTLDPIYVLPLLMGATMVIQQRLNPPPPDPIMAKALMFMPIIFTAFFAFFPSGLVLYWLTNSVLSIAQQWYIMQRVDKMHARKEKEAAA